ncbi:MAG: S41 family peptidase, partial [Granulosicoccus sp.]
MRSVALKFGLIFFVLTTGCSPDENEGNSGDVRLDEQIDVAQAPGSTQHAGDVDVSDQIQEELEKLDETQILDDTQEHNEATGLDDAFESNNASRSDEVIDVGNTSALVNISEPVENPRSVEESKSVAIPEPAEIPEIPEIPNTPTTPDTSTPPEMSANDKAAEPQEPEDTRESDVDNLLDQANTENVLFPDYVTPADIEKCSVEDLKRRVYWDMRDYYIYADQVPQLNLADYDSPESLIIALRVFPDVYSSVQDADTQLALYEAGQREGFEFWFSPANDGVVRFRHIWQGSPAFQAGIRRGDEVISLDGRLIEELSNSAINLKIFSPGKTPLTLTVRTADEEPRTVQVSREIYQWVTAGPVKLTASDEIPGVSKIAYLPVNSFVKTTRSEFDTAIAKIISAGDVEELIVDLRYNSGGTIDIAHYMAAVVGGEKVQGKHAYTNTWNSEYSSLIFTRSFDVLDQSLNLPRIIVLTTSFTASSSELFINSLKPYMEVVVIGERSRGKPYSNGIFEYCGKTLNIMAVERMNSVGVSVAGGIKPDCLVED